MSSLKAWVGAAQHLCSRHAEAGLGATAFLQQEGLEGVAACCGFAQAALDGARLPWQRGSQARGQSCRGSRWG